MGVNCRNCIHAAPLPYNSHIRCKHPIVMAGEGSQIYMPIMSALAGWRSGIEKRMNVSYDRTAFEKGHCFWPVNYDPIWINTCDSHQAP